MSDSLANYPLSINLEKCVGCGNCLKHCPLDALQLIDSKAIVDREACGTCGACADVCPTKAITISDIPIP